FPLQLTLQLFHPLAGFSYRPRLARREDGPCPLVKGLSPLPQVLFLQPSPAQPSAKRGLRDALGFEHCRKLFPRGPIFWTPSWRPRFVVCRHAPEVTCLPKPERQRRLGHPHLLRQGVRRQPPRSHHPLDHPGLELLRVS